MARLTKTFDAFGVNYRITEFAAVSGLVFMAEKDSHPIELLSGTEVQVGDDWIQLDNRESINLYVKDQIGVLPGFLVMRGICSIVSEFNFGFLNGWKGVRVPTRFISEGKSVATAYSDPLVAALVGNDVASLRELEEYYSLRDAFKQFDILMAKGINDALASEAATIKAKRR